MNLQVSTTYKNYTYKWFAEKGILGVKYVFFSENHVKLEMTNNSVIVGRIFLI